MRKQKGDESGFILLVIVLLAAAIVLAGMIYYFVRGSSAKVSSVVDEKPREFKRETTTPANNIVTAGSSPTPTNGQPISQKKILKISSYGNVDLGGGFTANLALAWDIYSTINTEVVLKNNYTSLLGLNINEFTLHGKGVVTKPTSKATEIGLEPGDTKTLVLTFKKIPDPPYTLEYDHPVSHTVIELGKIFIE